MNTLPASLVAALQNSISANLAAAGLAGDWMFQLAGFQPVEIQSNQSSNAANSQQTAIYYVSNAGNDANNGLSLTTAWLTPRAVSNATVVLAAGQTFKIPASAPLAFNDKINAIITTDSANPAIIQGQNGSPTTDITTWNGSTDCTLQNVIVDSDNGNGFGGNVRGVNPAIVNVVLKNLAEGFDWVNCNGVIQIGGSQVGKVAGRCHYYLGCSNFNISGGTQGVFGPSSAQSPIRFSTYVSNGVNYNNTGGSIDGLVVTQVGSPNPIACFAIHNAIGITFTDCAAIGGEFSLGDAGSATGDIVSNCTFSGLTVTNSKLDLQSIARNNSVVKAQITNPTGECVSLSTSANAGNRIVGGTFSSPKHGFHFYSNGDTQISQVTYNRQGNIAAPLMDGLCTAANNAGGNTVI